MNDQIIAIRQMLAEQGLPMTTENLNRAMLALARNQPMDTNGADTAMERTITRSMQPRAARPAARSAARPPSGAGPAQEPGPEQFMTAEDPTVPAAETIPMNTEVRNQPSMRQQAVNNAMRTAGDDAAQFMMFMPGVRGPVAPRNLGVTLAPRGQIAGPSAGSGGTAIPGAGAPALPGGGGTLPGGGGAAIAPPVQQVAGPTATAVAPQLSPMQQAFVQGPGAKANTLAEGARQSMSPVRDGMIARARRRVSETSGKRRDGATAE